MTTASDGNMNSPRWIEEEQEIVRLNQAMTEAQNAWICATEWDEQAWDDYWSAFHALRGLYDSIAEREGSTR